MTDDARADSPPPDAPRPKKRDIHGWLILDKPTGMTSTHAVSLAKRAFRAKKAGHAGTLDPLASGCLPIALGEATKTVPFVMDGRKSYRFEVAWGAETDTDDSEGAVVATSDLRPQRAEIEAALPAFIGNVMQTPPTYSAIKVAGERAYDLARDGEAVALKPREVFIESLRVAGHDADRTVFEADTGKGTYVRAIARDLGRALGCRGHVVELRRTRVGPFVEARFVAADRVRGAAGDDAALAALLAPVESALGDIPSVTVSHADAGRLMRGQGVILRGRDAPVATGAVAVRSGGALVAIGDVEDGELRPRRVFRLEG
jgi:tRNA pseudouridine55 synthase